MHNRTACNDAWTFITTNFTRPQIPPWKVYCLSTVSTFRLVHSEFRQYFHTFSPWVSDPRHIGNTIHLWTAFVHSLSPCLRLLSADFTELYKLLERAVACSPPFGVSGRRFGTLPPHFTHRNISSPKFRATIALRLCAQAFHLRTCRTIIVSITFQQVDNTPYCKTSSDRYYKSL